MKLGFGFGVFLWQCRKYLTKKWALSVRSCEAFIGDPKIGRGHCKKQRYFSRVHRSSNYNDIPHCSSFDLRIKPLDDFAILRYIDDLISVVPSWKDR